MESMAGGSANYPDFKPSRPAVLFIAVMKCWRCGGTGEIEDPLVLGQTLKKLRSEAGITSKRLAGALKVSTSYLCDLENGKRAWLGEVTPERYCDALDAEIERIKTQ